MAELPPISPLRLRVQAVEDLAPDLRQITVASEDLIGFHWLPGQDLELHFPLDGRTVSRRYSIRRADPGAGTLDLWFVLHGDGPAARWASGAAAGEELPAARGPRGKITVDPAADWHLFIGDESFLGASFAMLESLAGGGEAVAVYELGSEQARPPLAAEPPGKFHWLLPPGGDGADGRPALDSALALAPDRGTGRIYIAGEVRWALRLRDELLARGRPKATITAKGYWNRSKANLDHGEPREG